jgi:RND superfamily putative drug exporter
MSPIRRIPPRSARSAQDPPVRLARFVRVAVRGASRRPKLTIAAWLALIIACVALGSLSGTRTLSDSGSGVGEAAHAQARLTSSGLADPSTENVLVRSSSAPRTTAVVATLSRRARGLSTVLTVRTPRGTPGLSRAGGRTALVVVTLRGDPDDAGPQVAPLEHLVSTIARQSPGVSIQESGGASVDRAMNQIVDNGLHRAPS